MRIVTAAIVLAAATWGAESTEDLLDWLQVPRRHTLPSPDPGRGLDGAGLDGAGLGAPSLDGLVLIDLPDHDSTERGHRLEVDRMVRLIDLSEYKRKQAAVGLKVTGVAFGSGRRWPIAQRWRHGST